ncbi:MAG: protein adenylyltransferase SelO [Gammaproteobacteria bacterium]
MNANPEVLTLDGLEFDNRFVEELPGDPVRENHRRQVTQACYSHVLPTPVRAPRLVAYAAEVAELVDLDEAACRSADFAEVFAGNRLLPGMQPHATCYGGHQFGNWAGQLGDGRAINLGDVVNARGERWTLQLKGAGPTPYSRSADGLAVLRSSLREFLCSEAMHHLGVPTTRALCLVLTGEEVLRDMFYDGNAAYEPGAVVCRVAPSFTRFGHFQLPAARGEHALLRQLAAYTIRTDFPDIELPPDADDTRLRTALAAWFDTVCQRTAAMIVEWMRVGFVHGVMNTDNMSVLGLTIDYGPYGWLEDYDPEWTPNTTDAQGRRYRFGQQPQVALWNLVQLANAVYPLIEDTAPLEQALDGYREAYARRWSEMMAAKLGLDALRGSEDQALVDALFGVLGACETDMTLFFRGLGEVDPAAPATDGRGLVSALAPAYYAPDDIDADYRERLGAWLDDYAARLAQDGLAPAARRARMHAVNPRYVLRNYLAQLVIDEIEKGNFAEVDTLLDVLRRPYDDQPGMERFAARRPEWARHRAGCSMLSCSS